MTDEFTVEANFVKFDLPTPEYGVSSLTIFTSPGKNYLRQFRRLAWVHYIPRAEFQTMDLQLLYCTFFVPQPCIRASFVNALRLLCS